MSTSSPPSSSGTSGEPPLRSSPRWPSAASQVVGVIGDPVRQSLSPLLHNAAFDAMGLDWVSLAFTVRSSSTAQALDAMRALGIVGLSVTTPHKEAAAQFVDELTDRAALVGAVNCVVRREGTLIGDNTDGQGFVEALRRGAGFDPRGCRCVVLGAGGAARAVVVALAEAAAEEVTVVNRTRSRAESVARLVPDKARVGSDADLTAAQLVVQATTVGFTGSERTTSLPADPELLHEGQLVAELIYRPAVTDFMSAAEARGARTIGGLGMLVHQAALALERWTGARVPVEAMWKVVGDGYPGSPERSW